MAQLPFWPTPKPEIKERLPLKEIRKRLKRFGFGVDTWVVCPVTFSKKWRYEAYPLNGGSYSHFDTKDELQQWLLELERTEMYLNDTY